MKKLISLLVLFLVAQSTAMAQSPREGSWKGVIVYSNAEIPFTFEVVYPENAGAPILTFINGKDRASLEAIQRNDSLIIPMFAFDITLSMAIGEKKMQGELVKHYSNKSYSFEAEYGLPRYDIEEENDPVQIGSKWSMKVNVGTQNEYPAVALFEQDGNKVTGTIMTEVSDYRFFEGKIEGNEIEMSTFDGVHSFLFKGTRENGKWKGELVLDDGYSRKWEAEYDENASLTDPFEVVDLEGKQVKPDFEKLTALSGEGIIADSYKGKVLIIQIMGTWCSNSQDQTRYLTDWYEENRDRGVEILAVNYEANYSPEYGQSRIKTYKERLGIHYPMILGGELNKKLAADAFPFIDRIMAFPTLVFVGKEGYARYVHSYFTGPATVEYYEGFKRRFNTIVDELTSE
ncbi:MAG: TlpA family protein disulfide reductase [Gracilimonas sp.]|uniref:TlpA disulfide reductase family protein n=1 Tax=Gracilimonas sp. TaxID=1974203 RepID=UPI001996EAE5|nr:TlpA disulfide reductase family protein [Gracilimonas sp.]MBD3615971.1 TlpA family protein disulfide reductase [Gracilimonas sp.]